MTVGHRKSRFTRACRKQTIFQCFFKCLAFRTAFHSFPHLHEKSHSLRDFLWHVSPHIIYRFLIQEGQSTAAPDAWSWPVHTPYRRRHTPPQPCLTVVLPPEALWVCINERGRAVSACDLCALTGQVTLLGDARWLPRFWSGEPPQRRRAAGGSRHHDAWPRHA
jgi:hypothetical protein